MKKRHNLTPPGVDAELPGKRRYMDGSSTTISFPEFYLQVSLYGDKGVRKQMEDEHLVLGSLMALEPNIIKERDYSMFCVFDGHGGRQSASFAKSTLPAELAAQQLLYNEENSEAPVSNIPTDKEFKKVIYGAFQKLDSRIATEIPACRDGCTAVCVMMLGRFVYVASLGDSAAYLGRKIDNILHAVPLTDTHRPWVIEEKARITKMGGTIENGRVNGILEVTRSFGDISLKRYGVSCLPTLRKLQLDENKDEFILIACDGFWNALTARDALDLCSKYIEKEIRSSKVEQRPVNITNVCKKLIEHVLLDKKSQDNVSVILIRIVKGQFQVKTET